jgi:hypothetical protein
MEVDIVRSRRRRRTGEARVVDGVIVVSVPAGMTKAAEGELVSHLVGKIERKYAAEPIDLAARCEVLAARYGLPQPASVRWVDNQLQRWGSCTPADRSIRISARLARYPSWVIDAVLVHELAHLVELGHNNAFWALANRYPMMERARGFLIAKGWDDEADAPGAGERHDSNHVPMERHIGGTGRPGAPMPDEHPPGAPSAGDRYRRPRVKPEQATLF